MRSRAVGKQDVGLLRCDVAGNVRSGRSGAQIAAPPAQEVPTGEVNSMTMRSPRSQRRRDRSERRLRRRKVGGAVVLIGVRDRNDKRVGRFGTVTARSLPESPPR